MVKIIAKIIAVVISMILSPAIGGAAVEADNLSIVDYIVANNEEVIAMKNLTGLDLKLDARLSANAGTTGQYTDRAVAGLTMTIPLLDTRERRELKKRITELEAKVRNKAVAAISKYQAVIYEITQLSTFLTREVEYLSWFKKRVEVGIEYQKDYYKAEATYMGHKAKLSSAVADCQAARLELLALIKPDLRENLSERLAGSGGCDAR
ncbi:MAG: hypothetical protein ACK415_09740 [Thermodesulfovibrionales bacterium]